jgi:hypothetical protein
MNWEQWTGPEYLKAITRHTLHCTAVILSFMWMSWLVRKGLGEGPLASFIHYIDQFVVFGLFLVFVFNIGYDFYREIAKNLKGNQIVFS